MNDSLKQIVSLFLCFLCSGLTGCVDLSRAKLTPERKAFYYSKHPITKNHVVRSTYSQGEVHTLLGGLGMFSVGMNDIRDDLAHQYPHVKASSNIWYNAGDVTQAIVHYYYSHKEHRPIILIGHSLGANEQIKVARNLDAHHISVALLITVDAVSQTIVPANVKHVLNIYKPGYVPMFSGLKVKAVNPDRTRVENINVDDLKDLRVNHFTIDKNAAVQAMIFDAVKRVLVDANRKAV